MSAKIEDFREMPSEACEGCPFLQEGGCQVPYRVCWLISPALLERNLGRRSSLDI